MFRRIIAGTAVAGALTFGAAGTAGARRAPRAPTGADTVALCSCSRVQAKVQKVETKLTADVPKAQAREAEAKAAGTTKLADPIAARITRARNRETRVNARLAKAQAACSAGGTSAG